MSLETQVIIGSGEKRQEASLADLAGIDLAQVEANFGFAVTPAGTYVFRVKSTELSSMEFTPKGEDEPIVAPIVVYTFVATNCLNLNDKQKDTTEYIGIEHTETFFIRDLMKDLGRCRALMEQGGLQMVGTFQELLDGFIGMEIKCVVTNRPDKNDKDRIYANIDLKKVAPAGAGDALAGMVATAPTPAVAPTPAAAAPAPSGFSLNT